MTHPLAFTTTARLLARLLLFCLAAVPPGAWAADANGSWIGYICPQPGVNDMARCSSFYLRLYQRNDRICGSHLFATAGAGQMDEGNAPSVLGTVDKELVNATVESVRPAQAMRIPVTLQINDNELRWQRMENPKGDYLLPRNITLQRSRQGNLLSAVFEQRLASACAAYLDMPAEKPAEPGSASHNQEKDRAAPPAR